MAAAWLSLKADGVGRRPRAPDGSYAGRGHARLCAGRAVAGLRVDGFALVGEAVTDGPSNPLYSEVTHGRQLAGRLCRAALDRRLLRSGLCLGMAMAVRGLIGPGARSRRCCGRSLASLGMISSVGLTMFPFILPSTVDPNSSLTVWDSSSSHQTLFVMLVSTVIFMPLILAYTAWVYKVLWGKVTEA
jgi:cytochrome d ubiquinol oxidase subunit II